MLVGGGGGGPLTFLRVFGNCCAFRGSVLMATHASWRGLGSTGVKGPSRYVQWLINGFWAAFLFWIMLDIPHARFFFVSSVNNKGWANTCQRTCWPHKENKSAATHWVLLFLFSSDVQEEAGVKLPLLHVQRWFQYLLGRFSAWRRPKTGLGSNIW